MTELGDIEAKNTEAKKKYKEAIIKKDSKTRDEAIALLTDIYLEQIKKQFAYTE